MGIAEDRAASCFPRYLHSRMDELGRELKQARYVDNDWVIHRYLDSFPFPYYLIVHHLEDLPGALAALLRTWFAEVNA